MSLDVILLSHLKEKPMTGYELSKLFVKAKGLVWRASHQQIYRELCALHKASFVSVEEIPQFGKPGRRLYSITDKGICGLKSKIYDTIPVETLRDKVAARVMSVTEETLAEFLEQLLTYKDHCKAMHSTAVEVRNAYMVRPIVTLDEKKEWAMANSAVEYWLGRANWAASTYFMLLQQ